MGALEIFNSFVSPAVRMFKDKAPKKPKLDGEVAYADPRRLFPGQVHSYNPDELISRKGYRIYDQMRRDDQVKAALVFKKQSVLAAGWKICAPEGENEKEHEETIFLREMFFDLEGTFERSMLEVMTALDYGFSVTERVWEKEDGKIVLKALKTRAPHSWEALTDEYGNLVGASQDGREIPLEKLIWYAYEREFGNWYGKSDLNAAYRDWVIKDNAYRWCAMLLERNGIPPIFALYNPNSFQGTKATELNRLLTSMQAGTVGSIPRPSPEDLELWSPELAGQVANVFKPAFEMFNQAIARSLLMPGLLGMTNDQAEGSLARSQIHFDVFMLVLEFLRKDLQELVNEQVITPILDLNFAGLTPDERPYFEWQPITKDDRTQLLTAWQGLVGAKVVQTQDTDEEHAREMLGFPELSQDDADERAQRALDKMAAQQEIIPKPAFGAAPPGKPPFGKSLPGKTPGKLAEKGDEEKGDEVKKNTLNDDQFEVLMRNVFR